jgi:hypothetical protein
MHTVALRDEAIALAVGLGYAVRQEWFAGQAGGGCELRGQKILFLDLDLSPGEQLEQVLDALRREPDIGNQKLPMSPELCKLL